MKDAGTGRIPERQRPIVSPLTGLDIAPEYLDKAPTDDQWCRVDERPDLSYFVSAHILERCQRFPLPPEIAEDALTAVVVDNRLGETPAVICEVEEMFLHCQTHRWARAEQTYIVV